MGLHMFSFILMCWHYMQSVCYSVQYHSTIYAASIYRSKNNQALREIRRFTASCSVRFKCHGVSARTRNPACKYNPLLCSTLVFPPSSDTGNYAIHSLPSSASNHDSLPIRSHLSSVLEEASGVVERVSLLQASTHTESLTLILVCV